MDFDKPSSPLTPNRTRCDYLMVADGKNAQSWIVVLELKRGKLYADQVARQLQAGASAAEDFVNSSDAIRFRFRPIAVFGNTNKYERHRLKRKSIKFHKREEKIRTLSCGQKLTSALNQ